MARRRWRRAARAWDPTALIFLDETSTPTTLTPLRARSRRGERVRGHVPHRRWSTVTLMATLTPTGLGPGCQFPGALDRPLFEQFVAETLVPQLRPGQIVVLDNLAVHKSATAQQLIAAAGCRLVFLPTYSPDLNPIELAFSKLKQLLRASAPRTLDDVWMATARHYRAITAADARAFFRHAGYNL